MIVYRTIFDAFWNYSGTRKHRVHRAFANYIYAHAMDRGLLDGVAGVDELEDLLSNPELAILAVDQKDSILGDARRAKMTDNERLLVRTIVGLLADISPYSAGYTSVDDLYRTISLLTEDKRSIGQIMWSLMGES